MKSNKQGFTLIELIVVIAILGILAAVAIPKYIDLTQQAKKAHDDATLGGLRAATTLLYASNLVYNVTNIYGTYWPTNANVVASNMTDSVAATNWLYYTTHTYDPTTGVWTVQ